MIDIEQLWESDELSGTYFSAAEKSPNYEKVVEKIQDETFNEFNIIDLLGLQEEKPLTEKEIMAQRRAMRFKSE
jgi:hypothetical protein